MTVRIIALLMVAHAAVPLARSGSRGIQLAEAAHTGSHTTTGSFDLLGEVTGNTLPDATLTETRQYDQNVNLTSLTHTNGVSATYGYDDLNRLTSVVDANLAGAGTATYTYDTANNLGTVTYPNGIHTGFTYDQLNRVSTAVSQVAGYSYQRGPTGNLANVVELNGRTVNWTYDGINRLTSESITSDPSKNNGSVSYGLWP